MIKTLENFKSGNYEVVDNQGVSVTNHFIKCLENEIKDLIEPKFKIGQQVFYIDTYNFKHILKSFKISSILIYSNCIEYSDLYNMVSEENLFTTEQEAQEKLKEMKGNEQLF